jgi:hypothetical protein
MTRIRATTIQHDTLSGLPAISGRIEIAWNDEWLNMGLGHFHEEEWTLILGLLTLGARAACIQLDHVNRNT